MAAPATTDKRLALAAVAGAHGIKGEVRLKLFAESADSLKAHRKLFVGGVECKLASLNAAGTTPIALFEGVADRTQAEALRGQLIEVERSALPPLGDGEYYHSDLIGLPCIDKNGAAIGEVVAVENFGAGDLLEVETAAGKKALIPFRDSIADLVDGRIVIDPEFLA